MEDINDLAVISINFRSAGQCISEVGLELRYIPFASHMENYSLNSILEVVESWSSLILVITCPSHVGRNLMAFKLLNVACIIWLRLLGWSEMSESGGLPSLRFKSQPCWTDYEQPSWWDCSPTTQLVSCLLISVVILKVFIKFISCKACRF